MPARAIQLIEDQVKAFSVKQVQDKEMLEGERVKRIEEMIIKRNEKNQGKGGHPNS